MNIFLKVFMILIMTVSGTFGAFFFKKGTVKLEGNSIFKILMIPEIYIGGFFYVLGAALNIVLLRYMNYTTVYPLTSLTYVWTLIVSMTLLKESINFNKIMAIVCIVFGVIVICI